MWIHLARPGNTLYDLARDMGLNISRKQNYNSGDEPGGQESRALPLPLCPFCSRKSLQQSAPKPLWLRLPAAPLPFSVAGIVASNLSSFSCPRRCQAQSTHPPL
jgi:hypothetical protein